MFGRSLELGFERLVLERGEEKKGKCARAPKANLDQYRLRLDDGLHVVLRRDLFFESGFGLSAVFGDEHRQFFGGRPAHE